MSSANRSPRPHDTPKVFALLGAAVAIACSLAGPSWAQQPASATPAKPAPATAPASEPAPAAKSSTKPPETSQPNEATIGNITRLAREIRVEQLRKELMQVKRESGQAPALAIPPLASISGAVGTTGASSTMAAIVPTGAPTGAAAVAVPQTAPAVKDFMAPPVAAIGVLGSTLRARLSSGAALELGQMVTGPDGRSWQVRAVTLQGVTFEHCEPPGDTSGGKPALPQPCINRFVMPSGA